MRDKKRKAESKPWGIGIPFQPPCYFFFSFLFVSPSLFLLYFYNLVDCRELWQKVPNPWGLQPRLSSLSLSLPLSPPHPPSLPLSLHPSLLLSPAARLSPTLTSPSNTYLIISQFNAYSLFGHITIIKAYFALHFAHIISISETWLHASISDKLVTLPGYFLIRNESYLVCKPMLAIIYLVLRTIVL